MIKYCRYCIRRFHKFFVGDFFWDSILSNLSSIYKMEKITVDQAIQRGQQMVNYPIFAIMIIGFGFSIYLVTILKSGLHYLKRQRDKNIKYSICQLGKY